MNPGDTHKVGSKSVTVVTVEPDANGEIVVRTADGFYTTVTPEALEPDRPTYRADTPYGQVTVELPVDGNPEVRAVWSQAATDGVVAKETLT